MPRFRQLRCAALFVLLCLSMRSSTNVLQRQYGEWSEDKHPFNSTPSLNTTAPQSDYESKKALNVTLTFKQSRRDRMGSRIQLPLGAWLISRYYDWNFCAPPDRMARALSFPMCASGYETLKYLEGPKFSYTDDTSIMESGVYYISRVGNTLWATIGSAEQNGVSMLEKPSVEEWRRMILGARVRPELDGELWLSKDSVRIALHVRRGDILPGVRNDVWIGDDQTIALIEMAKYYVHLKRGPDIRIEVHLFSESYGATNWTRYGALVDQFHLAREGSDDIELNLRDWKHFVLADVLIVGGTFSHLPALARGRPTKDGFPMTIMRGNGGGVVMREWIPWVALTRGGCRTVKVHFPNGTITANIGPSSEPEQNDDGRVSKLQIESIIGNTYEKRDNNYMDK